MNGSVARSQNVPSSCPVQIDRASAPAPRAAVSADAVPAGACTESASVKRSHSPRAAAAPWTSAHGLPIQPSGSSAPRITRTFGWIVASRSRIAGVASVDRSSTTTTSTRAKRCSASDPTHASIERSSFRAGTIAVTVGSGAAGSSSSKGTSYQLRGNVAARQANVSAIAAQTWINRRIGRAPWKI